MRVPTDTLKHRVQAYLIPDIWRVSPLIRPFATGCNRLSPRVFPGSLQAPMTCISGAVNLRSIPGLAGFCG